MRVGCEHCGAAYSVADEKVAGRRLKLRCKKCGEPIVVDGAVLASAAAPPDEPDAVEAPAAREPVRAPQPIVASEPDAAWHVAVGDASQGPYTLDELAGYRADGTIGADTLVYRQGWSDWRLAAQVPELEHAAAPRRSAAPPRPAPVPRALSRAPEVQMGNDPFAEAPPAQGPRVSAAEMTTPGAQHEGTVQFSFDQIRALSAASLPNPAAAAPSVRPGYASGEGSGLIDVASLAGGQADEAYRPIMGAEISPLDTLAPVSLPASRAASGIDLRTKVFASLAALGFVLASGIAVLALTRRPPPPPVVALAQPVAAPAAVPVAAPAVPAAAPDPQPVAEPEQAAPPEAAQQDEAAQADETAQAEPEQAAEHRPRRSSHAHRGISHHVRHERAAAVASHHVSRDEGIPLRDSSSKSKAKGSDEDLFAKASPPEHKKGGSPTLDELLDGAVSGKKAPPKSEPAPKSDLPATPSRDAMLAALTRAKAKVAGCKGSGIATAAISISGSRGRATSVSVSGVDAAAKSCVERAVRSTPFPKFQKSSFEVKFPFKLGA